MTYYATDEKVRPLVEEFRRFDVDTQLGLLWFGYLDLKDQLNPVNANSSQTVAEAVFHQIEALSKEEQLQAQRDIASCANSPISHQYGALDSSAKIDVWLRLAQGMEDGRIIQVPSDYQPPSETNNFVEQIQGLEFEQRLNFMRSLVMEMGARQ